VGFSLALERRVFRYAEERAFSRGLEPGHVPAAVAWTTVTRDYGGHDPGGGSSDPSPQTSGPQK
jgi:hypothetical protein